MDWDNLEFDAEGHLVNTAAPVVPVIFPPPPPLRWVCVADLPPKVFGVRVAYVTSRGPWYDHRAASEVFENNGSSMINIVTEFQWFEWVLASEADRPTRPPKALCVHARRVWAQVDTGDRAQYRKTVRENMPRHLWKEAGVDDDDDDPGQDPSKDVDQK